jgi:hypothetical protein
VSLRSSEHDSNSSWEILLGQRGHYTNPAAVRIVCEHFRITRSNSSDQSTFRPKISNESRRFKPFTKTLDGDPGGQSDRGTRETCCDCRIFAEDCWSSEGADIPEEERQLARRSDKPFRSLRLTYK